MTCGKMTMYLRLFCLVVALSFVRRSLEDCYTYDTEMLNVQTKDNENATLKCDPTANDTNSTDDRGFTYYWIVRLSEPISNFTMNSKEDQAMMKFIALKLGGYSNISLEQNGKELTVVNIQEEVYGAYYCIILNGSLFINMFRHGINVNGPLYPSMWDRYDNGLLYAGIAGGSFLLIMIVLCLICHMCCEKKAEEEENVRKGSVIEMEGRNGPYPSSQTTYLQTTYHEPQSNAVPTRDGDVTQFSSHDAMSGMMPKSEW